MFSKTSLRANLFTMDNLINLAEIHTKIGSWIRWPIMVKMKKVNKFGRKI